MDENTSVFAASNRDSLPTVAAKIDVADEPIARRIAEVLKVRAWTPYQLSVRSGLSSDSHVASILRRGAARTGADTLRKIAEGAGVRVDWLVRGEGPSGLEGLSDRPRLEHVQPAAPTEHIDAPAHDGSLEGALDAAFDAARHRPSDAIAVQKALGETFRFESGTDPLGAARTWLDAAARLRREGREVTTSRASAPTATTAPSLRIGSRGSLGCASRHPCRAVAAARSTSARGRSATTAAASPRRSRSASPTSSGTSPARWRASRRRTRSDRWTASRRR